MEKFYTSNAPAPVGPYSQAIGLEQLIFCSGQAALNPKTGKIETTSVAEQTHLTLQNLEAVLAASGSGLQHVVKCNVYLKDMDDFQEMNKVYEEVFAPHKPARTTIEAARLPLDALVEIECVALRK
ncbi:MAG: Rid family detoxifying hydrolase [Bacteroidota bacterium]